MKLNFLTLKNPYIVLLSILLGIISGLLFPVFSQAIKPIGDIYLSLLKMVVIPIVITAVISSVGHLFYNKSALLYTKRLLITFFVMLFTVGFIGVIVALIIKPGVMNSPGAKEALGDIILGATDTQVTAPPQEVSLFFQNLIPENIFKALSDGANLQVLFFSLTLGIALGFLEKKQQEYIMNFADALYSSLLIIIEGFMYLLPFALFALISNQIATIGIGLLLAMLKFVISIYVTGIIVMILAAIVSWKWSSNSFMQTLTILKRPLIIAFGTQSVYAALPTTLKALKDLKLNKEVINFVIPLGAVMMRFSMLIVYSVAMIFAIQLYQFDISILSIVSAIAMCVLAAVGGAGTPGLVSMSFMTLILHPLQVPSEAIILLLIGIYPLVKPIATTADLFANCASTIVIANTKEEVIDD